MLEQRWFEVVQLWERRESRPVGRDELCYRTVRKNFKLERICIILCYIIDVDCSKWAAHKKGVYSIELCHTEKHLLTGGRGTIKLWNLDNLEMMKVSVRFTVNQVFVYSRST